MKRKARKKLWIKVIFAVLVCLLVLGIFSIPAGADEYETMPGEYTDFFDSIDGEISDKLPSGLHSGEKGEINAAAKELIAPAAILGMLVDALSVGIENAAPTLALVLGIVVISAILSAFARESGGLSRVVEGCIRLCTFTAISGIAVKCVESLSLYFERLFSAVAAFLPLSAARYAMGGNLTTAASSTTVMGITLTICQFFCTKTVIPVFCICLCTSMLSSLEGQEGVSAGGTVSGMIRKWYTAALAFVMMILTCSLGGSTLLSSKADNVAMRGAKFAVSSFIPVSGGAVSSTLGNLAASIELLRGSVGIIGIVIILMMLLPTLIELALLRGVFLLGGFCASTLGSNAEAKLLSQLDSLYGYLEGIAVLSAVIFIIAFGVFASVSTPFG